MPQEITILEDFDEMPIEEVPTNEEIQILIDGV